MENVDAVGILQDCMLPLVGRITEDGWMQAFLNEEVELALLPRLAATCREWRDSLFTSVQYSALRIAIAIFSHQTPGGLSRAGSRRRKEQMEFITSHYLAALFYLSRSWALQVDVGERICTSPLSELSLQELQLMLMKIQSGWGATEIKHSEGEKVQPSSTTWITPTHRQW
ncbi:hypothetical protein M758_UG264200 [Ceratodon purpureus]|nr:hypothetical protein M758_UG264200 [Ceratodon purpureus]